MKRALMASAMAVGALRLAGMGLGLLVTVVIGRTLGAQGLGAYGYAVILLTLATVPVSYGWGTLLLRSVAGALKGGQWAESKGMMRRGTQFAAVVAALAAATLLLLSLLGVQPGAGTFTAGMGLLLSAVLFLDQLSALRLAVLRGLDQPVWGQLPEMLLRPALILVCFGILFLVVGREIGLQHAFWALAVGALGAALLGSLVLRRKAPRPLQVAGPVFHTRDWMRSAVLMAGNSGLLLLNSYTDILLLGALGTLEQVGIYRIATQCALLSGFVYTAANMLATPRFATLRAAGDTAALQSTATFMARLALIGAIPLPLLFAAFGPSLLRLVFGPGFDAAYLPMFVLFLGQVVNAASGMASSLLMMSGHEGRLLRFTLLAVLVNAAASALLIPGYGVMGAAVGNALAATVWNVAIWLGSLRLTGIDTSIVGRFGYSAPPAPAAPAGRATPSRRHQPMQYRREIDGLRAVAVVPVMLFHAGLSTFSGGFVGVDVFFVISGYLITYIILEELEKGSFSVARFYERRARRILPALFLVLVVCLPLAWQLLTPVDMKEFARSVIAVVVFSSNVLFWQQSGYFDTASELKPLLHTWSLAVEEQFYVIFPLLLAFLWKFGRRAASFTLAGILLVSLALAEWSVARTPDAAFYLLHTRAWELMLGALAAVFVSGGHDHAWTERHPNWSSGAATLGMALIAVAVFAFDESIPFPGAYALVPTVGTVLIILFARPGNLAGRVLGNPVLVGIGLISYSAYLWHQPLLAFARHASLNEPPLALMLAMCAASLVLAGLSWKLVETPFRRRGFLTRNNVFGLSAAGLLAFGVFGALGNASEGFRTRWGPEFAKFQPDNQNFFRYTGCASNPKQFIPPEAACSYGGEGDARIAVVGDSHARALVFELSEAGKKRGFKVTQFTYEGCPPIVGVYRADQGLEHRCYDHNKATLDHIAANPKLEYVVLAARWPLYLERGRFDNGEGGVEKGQPLHLDLVVDGKRQTAPEAARVAGIQQRMRDTVARYLAAGKKVIVVQPVPEVGWYVPDYLMKVLARKGSLEPADASISLAAFEARSRRVGEAFAPIGPHANLRFVQPASHLCNTVVSARCVTHLNAVPLYRDADHLSNLGVRLIVEEILQGIPENTTAAAPRG